MAGKAGKYVLFGCFGCLGLIVLVALIGGGSVGLVAMTAEDEQLEERTHVADLPMAARIGAGSGSGDAESPAGAGNSEGSVIAEAIPGWAGPVGRLELALMDGEEFTVVPGEPGSLPQVWARYDRNMYTLTESLETRDDGWTYSVYFERTGSAILAMLKSMGMMEGTEPEIEISLPPDMPIAIGGRVSRAGSRLELGGLWITEFELDVTQGAGVVSFDRPLVAPMERLVTRNRMGGMVLNDLGNASPRVIDTANSMGGLVIDLDGEWRGDSELLIEASSTGGVTVRLPDNMQILGLSEYSDTADPESALPKLHVQVDGPEDNVEFRR
ncbi:hypothetical protein ABI59_08905 [Acidobacteria bacterium Mor1]|nr:hypothetical protein ABI59_08905 [Acidobacteria bacterium Mor1]